MALNTFYFIFPTEGTLPTLLHLKNSNPPSDSSLDLNPSWKSLTSQIGSDTSSPASTGPCASTHRSNHTVVPGP